MEIKREDIKNSKKPWILLVLIIITILIPQIVADQFTTDFSFVYPIGDEYRMWKTISALAGAFLIYLFMERFYRNKIFSVFLILLSFVPIIRLIIVTALFLTWKANNNSDQNLVVIPLGERIKNIVLMFIGYSAIYNFLFGMTGILFFSVEEAVISNLLRILISIALIYYIYKRNIYFNKTDFIIYMVISIFILFFVLV